MLTGQRPLGVQDDLIMVYVPVAGRRASYRVREYATFPPSCPCPLPPHVRARHRVLRRRQLLGRVAAYRPHAAYLGVVTARSPTTVFAGPWLVYT